MLNLVLLVNDDGVEAEGLRVLEERARALARRVVVVAPRHEQSSRSHAITLRRTLQVESHGPDRFSVDGTPADAVLVALFGLLSERPDLVLSGVNHGHNLGEDVFYSGTVGAAREAALYGIPSIAISQGPMNGSFPFDTTRVVLEMLLPRILGFPSFRLLNVNIPGVEPEALRGIRPARLGNRVYENPVEALGENRFRIGGSPRWHPQEGTDLWAVEQGFVSITPLTLDLTDHEGLTLFETVQF